MSARKEEKTFYINDLDLFDISSEYRNLKGDFAAIPSDAPPKHEIVVSDDWKWILPLYGVAGFFLLMVMTFGLANVLWTIFWTFIAGLVIWGLAQAEPSSGSNGYSASSCDCVHSQMELLGTLSKAFGEFAEINRRSINESNNLRIHDSLSSGSYINGSWSGR